MNWSRAPTSRARCKGKCGENIRKDELRLSIPSYGSGGFAMTSYRCLPCVTKKQFEALEKQAGCLEDSLGFRDLDEAARVQIREAFVVACGPNTAGRNFPTKPCITADNAAAAPNTAVAEAAAAEGLKVNFSDTTDTSYAAVSSRFSLHHIAGESNSHGFTSPAFTTTPTTPPADADTRSRLEAALMPFQREGVRKGLEWEGRLLLCDEMGLGKTLQAIQIAVHYRDEW